MSNTYLEVTIEKKSLTQDIEFLSLNVRLQFTFWGPPTHPDIIEVSNFFLQLKNQSKSVCDFSIVFILKGIMTFQKSKKNVHAFVEKNINFNKNDTQSQMENLTEFRRDEPCVLAHIRIANQK